MVFFFHRRFATQSYLCVSNRSCFAHQLDRCILWQSSLVQILGGCIHEYREKLLEQSDTHLSSNWARSVRSCRNILILCIRQHACVSWGWWTAMSAQFAFGFIWKVSIHSWSLEMTSDGEVLLHWYVVKCEVAPSKTNRNPKVWSPNFVDPWSKKMRSPNSSALDWFEAYGWSFWHVPPCLQLRMESGDWSVNACGKGKRGHMELPRGWKKELGLRRWEVPSMVEWDMYPDFVKETPHPTGFGDSYSARMDQRHSKLRYKSKWSAHADWSNQSGDESAASTIPPWRNQSLWRITTTRTVEGLSEQRSQAANEVLLKKHASEYTKLMWKNTRTWRLQGMGRMKNLRQKRKDGRRRLRRSFLLWKNCQEELVNTKWKRTLKRDKKKSHYLKEVRRRSMREERNKALLSHRYLASGERVEICRRPRSNPFWLSVGRKGWQEGKDQ